MRIIDTVPGLRRRAWDEGYLHLGPVCLNMDVYECLPHLPDIERVT